MSLLLLPLIIFFAGALLQMVFARRVSIARVAGPAVTVAGALAGLIPVIRAFGGKTITTSLPWSMPFGLFSVEMDGLSALFALPILVISALAAVYGAEYLKTYEGRKSLSSFWFFYNLLAGSMLLVVTARNAILFLLALEVMSLSSFFLVIFENEQEHARRAGWTYLVATHIGTAFLLVLFCMLGSQAGTLDFSGFSAADAASGFLSAAFLLAVIGFGTKAGFMPMHVWLPEAHPAAPSHVSAVMSGVMIKTGIYGLLRILTRLGMPPPWWGWVLVAIGAASGILGIVFALSQHDIKRLLAYSSVENVGIITTGIGIGMLGMHYGNDAMMLLGFAGALLHVLNHSIFKSLLFLGAGSILHAAATREIDRLGGLMKRMPATGLTFLVGSVAICGLPPLNGFLGEFIIYLGSFKALTGSAAVVPAAGVVVIAALALIGGLAAVCFTKAFGMIFLGEPRSDAAAHAHECGLAMRFPILVLAALCVAVGLAGPFIPKLLIPAVQVLADPQMTDGNFFAPTERLLTNISLFATGVLALTAILLALRARLLKNKPVSESVTWDCGYAVPTARMQYTASSYADPVVRLFKLFLQTRKKFVSPEGLFPEKSSFSSATPDFYRERMYRPIFNATEKFLTRFQWLQHGRLNLYILCIMVTLIVILVWKLR
ncbi:MAG: proton-conducting transporter membrane subunit [Kiritimatiellae bacterium]|nr:proton-conducting transporter membrane subunit [Kiritimatiellia bacterium]